MSGVVLVEHVYFLRDRSLMFGVNVEGHTQSNRFGLQLIARRKGNRAVRGLIVPLFFLFSSGSLTVLPWLKLALAGGNYFCHRCVSKFEFGIRLSRFGLRKNVKCSSGKCLFAEKPAKCSFGKPWCVILLARGFSLEARGFILFVCAFF